MHKQLPERDGSQPMERLFLGLDVVALCNLLPAADVVFLNDLDIIISAFYIVLID